MSDLNSRIKQLTKLILTSQTVDELKGDESRPASSSKLDFDLSTYQVRRHVRFELRISYVTRHYVATARTTTCSSSERSPSHSTPFSRGRVTRTSRNSSRCTRKEKDILIAEQMKTLCKLEIVVRGYEENLGEPLRALKEDVEKEWMEKLEAEVKRREEKEIWADELVKQLEKEKQVRSLLLMLLGGLILVSCVQYIAGLRCDANWRKKNKL